MTACRAGACCLTPGMHAAAARRQLLHCASSEPQGQRTVTLCALVKQPNASSSLISQHTGLWHACRCCPAAAAALCQLRAPRTEASYSLCPCRTAKCFLLIDKPAHRALASDPIFAWRGRRPAGGCRSNSDRFACCTSSMMSVVWQFACAHIKAHNHTRRHNQDAQPR